MSQATVERVAANVRAEAARQRRSVEELAKVMGVSAVTVRRRLQGGRPGEFTVAELVALAGYFGVPIDRLTGADEAAS